MKRVTKKEVEEAAKTKRGALNISIRKYLYLLQLTKDQVRKLHKNFLYGDYCGFCEYYIRTSKCPFADFEFCSGNNCLDEWAKMVDAHYSLQNPLNWTRPDEEYNTFLSNAAQIYVKLLKIKGTI